MSQKILARADLEANSATLAEFIRQNTPSRDPNTSDVIYVCDPDGVPFTGVSLMEETLTDGSKVLNFLLTYE